MESDRWQEWCKTRKFSKSFKVFALKNCFIRVINSKLKQKTEQGYWIDIERLAKVFGTRTLEVMGWDNAIKKEQLVRERIEESNSSTIKTLHNEPPGEEYDNQEHYETVS